MSKKEALYEQVANSIIEKLENEVSPFNKPWNDANGVVFQFPFNPTTEKNYRGMNSLWLAMQGREDPRWMTFKQAQKEGWNVRKGEKASTINFVKKSDVRIAKDGKGKPILDEKGKPKKIVHYYASPIITTAWVFNAEQINGIRPLAEIQKERETNQKWTNIERAESIVQSVNATVRHGGNDAYYSPTSDHIQMPFKDQFNTAEGYYGVLLHEVGHWTGEENRLNRDLTGRFGTESYAKEELIAEIASYMIRGEIGGLDRELDNTAAYAKSWISILKNDPYEIFRAASSAQKVYDYVLDFEPKRELKIEENKEVATKKANVNTFEKGEEISYKDQTYQVLDVKGQHNIEVKVLETGAMLRVSDQDGLFTSLKEAKKNPLSIGFDKQVNLSVNGNYNRQIEDRKLATSR